MIRIILRSLSIGVAVVSSFTFAQTGGKTEVLFSPVPLWPSDDIVPEDLKEHTVFLKPESQEIVVVSDSFDASGKKVRLAFELHNNAQAAVTARLTKNATTEEYSYDYTVRNAARSKRGIERMSLLIPREDKKFSSKSTDWDASDEPTDKAEKPAHKHIPLRYLHFKIKAPNGLVPGLGSSFQIMSENLPGYPSVCSAGHSE